MRIPLATDLKTRTGAPSTKDARLTNSYAELKGQQSVVRKRPAGAGGIPIGTGQAQGGIGFSLGGTNYLYTLNGDISATNTLATLNPSWNVATSYGIGAMVYYPPVSDPFDPTATPYYALIANTGVTPTDPLYWSPTPIGTTRYIGNYNTIDGPQTASIASAGYAAWLANELYQSCATKNIPTQSWRAYDSTDASTLKIYIHQYTDTSPYTCSTTPLDLGIVQLLSSDLVRVV